MRILPLVILWEVISVNILFVIGTTALICNVPFDQKFVIDTIVAIFSGVLLWAGTIQL